ncbi:MAG: 2-oxoacid:acceptor oxidoreductase family protein [bacterium]|nr:2-oxoacid:acceptor oxidoreductase family protein [bacterium]
MIEIRFHGRGGQGALTAAEVFALAAFLEGKEAQHFPQFGAERRGAPVAVFCRIDDKPITIHSNIYQPDCVVVLDISLIKTINVTAGLKENGWLILNTSQKPEYFRYLLGSSKVESGFRHIATVDATSIAFRRKLGSEAAPIVNTTILGAVAKTTEAVKMEAVLKAIAKKIGQKTSDNIYACEEAFKETQIQIIEKEGENIV